MPWLMGLIRRKWIRPTACWKASAMATSFTVRTGTFSKPTTMLLGYVLARLDDREITRFIPYNEVRRILLTRSPAQLSVNRLELGAQPRQPSADKSYA